MNVPEGLHYTREHEWARIAGDVATVGITDYAQSELGDIVYVQTASIGDKTIQGKPCGSIEAVKAVSDLFAPLSGEVIAVNPELADNPQLVNQDPYGKGWILQIRLTDPAEVNQLLSAEAYAALIT